MTNQSAFTDAGDLHVMIVGAGVSGLSCAQAVLDSAEDRAINVRITLLEYEPGSDTASRSGGLVMQFSCADPRAPQWVTDSGPLWRTFRERHMWSRAYILDTPTLLLSEFDDPEVPDGHLGDPRRVDPAAEGFPQFSSAVRLDDGVVVDTCGFLPVWRARLIADNRVVVLPLVPALSAYSDVASYADLFGADVTVIAIGMGMRGFGDSRLEAVMGVLWEGGASSDAHRDQVVMFEDSAETLCYTIPHGVGQSAHVHVGGTLTELHADDPDELTPEALREFAIADGREVLERVHDYLPLTRSWDLTNLWFGLRPVRSIVVAGSRVSPDASYGHVMYELYGHGGSGWSINPAIVATLAKTILSHSESQGEKSLSGGADLDLHDEPEDALPPDVE